MMAATASTNPGAPRICFTSWGNLVHDVRLRAASALSWETQVPTLLDAYRPLLPAAGATSTASSRV